MCRCHLFLVALCVLFPVATPFFAPSVVWVPSLAKQRLSSALTAKSSPRIFHSHSLLPSWAPAVIRGRQNNSRRTLSQLKCAEVTVCEQFQGLVEWIRKEGGWVSPSIAAGSIRDGERGVFAVSEAGGALAFVPLGCCLAVSEGDSTAGEVELLGQNAPLKTRLALKLMQETKSAGSKLGPYLHTLPSSAAFADHPIFWTEEELALLGDVALADGLRKDREEVTRVFNGLDHCQVKGSLNDWMWAMLIVGSRTYGRITESGATLALEPLIDLVNHARFRRHGEKGGRNCLHSYIEKGTQITGSSATALRDLPEGLKEEGCACLFGVERLEASDEVLVSYRDLEVGGVLSAAECLRAYGFVCGDPTQTHDPADWGFALGTGVWVQEETAARSDLAAMVDAAVKEGQGREELLQVVLTRYAAKLSSGALSDYNDMTSQRGNRGRIATSYRLSRRIAMGRAAVAMVPRDAVSSKAVRQAALEGAGGDEKFMAWFWPAWTKPCSALEDAQTALERLSPVPGPSAKKPQVATAPSKGFAGARAKDKSKAKGKKQ